MRGEYGHTGGPGRTTVELPPHARRILQTNNPEPKKLGTTSACAENTLTFTSCTSSRRNYLRMRGEYTTARVLALPRPELPPHARRIRLEKLKDQPAQGTTSACAENTIGSTHHRCPQRNYLRMRGEYVSNAFAIERALELPPHARRIPDGLERQRDGGGTTSACAENTLSDTTSRFVVRNYLRMRGEYPGSPLKHAT